MTGHVAAGSASPADAVALLRRLGHQLRSPLTTVVGFAAMLAAEADEEDAAVAAAHDVAAAAHRVQLVLDTMVAWASPAPVVRAEPVDLAAAVAAALADLTPAAAEAPAVDPVPDVALRADPALLRLLLRQLLDNAFLHAVPDGRPRVRVSAETSDAGWRLRVVDDGRGVPAADSERVRRPYVRLSRDLGRPGAGLGLAVADRIAVAHGGRLRLSATPGGGTTVTLVAACGD